MSSASLAAELPPKIQPLAAVFTPTINTKETSATPVVVSIDDATSTAASASTPTSASRRASTVTTFSRSGSSSRRQQQHDPRPRMSIPVLFDQLSTAVSASAECAKVRFAQVRNQYLAMCCANIITLGQGCAIGWISSAVMILKSAELTPLADGPATTAQISWIASTSSIGAALGAILFGWVCGRIGSRNSTWLCAVPLTLFWLIVMCADRAWQLCVGRLLSGLTGGAFVSIQLFLADISDDNIRGRLGSFLSLYLNIGILLGYVAGTYLDYATVPYVMVAFPLLFICCFAFVPNTPQYLLRCGDTAGAERAMRFYKNCDAAGSGSLTAAAAAANQALFAKQFEALRSVVRERCCAPAVCWADFCNRRAVRALLIGPTLMAVNQFSGTFLIITYAASIFRDATTDFDPHVSAMVVGGLQICGTYATSLFIDRLGRRVLLIVSASGTAVGLAMMVAYMHLQAGPCDVSALRLVPVISLSVVTVVASMGLGSVPYVIIAEVLPQRIRTVGTTICTTTVSVYAFVVLQSFPHLEKAVGLSYCFTGFLCVACLGVVFVVCCVHETKGKSLDVLDDVPTSSRTSTTTATTMSTVSKPATPTGDPNALV